MPMIALLAAAATAAAPPSGTIALPGMLAPLGQGKLMCVTPNKAQKSCLSINGLRLGPRGELVSWSRIWVGDLNGTITGTAQSVVALKGGEICDPSRPADIEAIRYTWAAGKLNAKQLDFIRTKVKERAQPYMGREVCQQIFEDAGGLVMTARINGVQEPKLTQRFIWVTPKDGYKLGV